MKHFWPLTLLLLAVWLLASCGGPMTEQPLIVLPPTSPELGGGSEPAAAPATVPETNQPAAPAAALPTVLPPTPLIQPTRPAYSGQPTPDPPHTGQNAAGFGEHVVTAGETLAAIAGRYGSTVAELAALNQIQNGDLVFVGQVLRVPAAPTLVGPDLKLIPDSELVYGPRAADFRVRAYLSTYYPQGALGSYRETVEDREMDGPAIVELVALRYSVNPRLLLAMLEHRAGWVTRPPAGAADPYPMGYVRNGFEGLYTQLGWAANRANGGYYGRAEGGWVNTVVDDGTRVAFAPTINDGTAGVQNWLAGHTGATYAGWLAETGAGGFPATYERLFGSPFALTYEPLLPADLRQPPLALPWEPGIPWYYTSGPHGGWAAGSAWAALDFGPDRERRGCYVSDAWVTAALDGTVIFSDMGGVLVDQDGDGHLGTGWVIVYWHIDRLDRVEVGTALRTGDRIGHPSCEGGFSNGTHLHIARRYNGRWISADGAMPFVLDDWVVEGAGVEYDGWLRRGDEVKEACICAEDGNEIIR